MEPTVRDKIEKLLFETYGDSEVNETVIYNVFLIVDNLAEMVFENIKKDDSTN